MNNGTEKGTREGVTVSLENPFTAAPVETDPAGRCAAVQSCATSPSWRPDRVIAFVSTSRGG
jgi:hypothetical protein